MGSKQWQIHPSRVVMGVSKTRWSNLQTEKLNDTKELQSTKPPSHNPEHMLLIPQHAVSLPFARQLIQTV